MDAFFAAVEQLDHPAWRARPLVVTNGKQGSCIITCSYEARAFGIKTGMRLTQARRLCPDLIQAPSRPARYASLSHSIMQALQQVTPDIEIFSVDEAFLDVTACQRLHGGPVACAKLAKQVVFEAVQLHCSVGLSGDKTTAKYAAKLDKPNGLTVIHPAHAAARLAYVPVQELCGIAKGVARFLASYGAYTCADVAKLPMSSLSRRFGNQGRRLWLMCQGRDPAMVRSQASTLKSMGHGKVIPPNTRCKSTIVSYFLYMCYKLSGRLRRNQLQAQEFRVAYRTANAWVAIRHRLAYPSSDHLALLSMAKELLQQHWRGEGVFQVQVTALDPLPTHRMGDLLTSPRQRHKLQQQACLGQVEAAVQERFGMQSLLPARLVGTAITPDVIAPAWRAEGARQSLMIQQLPNADDASQSDTINIDHEVQ